MIPANCVAMFKYKSESETYITITPVIGWVKDDDVYVSLVVYPPIDTNVTFHNLALPSNSNEICESFGELQKLLTKDSIKKESLSLKQWSDKDSDNRFVTFYMVDLDK